MSAHHNNKRCKTKTNITPTTKPEYEKKHTFDGKKREMHFGKEEEKGDMGQKKQRTPFKQSRAHHNDHAICWHFASAHKFEFEKKTHTSITATDFCL